MRIEDDKYWREAARLPYSDEGDLGDDYDDNEGYPRGSRPSVLREVVETILVTLLIFFVVRSVVQNFKVEGDSMLPTLHSEQYLLVNKGLYFRYDANFLAHLTNPDVDPDMRYLFHGPQRGDIVVFESWHEERDFIKRVIAVEGETVEVRPDPSLENPPQSDCDGCCNACDVYVNNIKLNEPYINERPNYRRAPIVVPPGHIYVLGDNRRNSSDSHVQGNGPLPVDRIVGTAFVSY
ncbi:MAG: signal peptidase I, partial [Chloroflexota bacterium]|nr:signal peptidase I [Chloroflexota bacterium]